jgi:pyruvate dehydrogenase E1 component alpha subunit
MRTERDCIEHVRKRLVDEGVTDAEVKVIDDEVKKVVAEAAEFAQSSPEPDASELWTDVLVEG